MRTAGLAYNPGKPVAANAVTVMAELGIDISNEYSKPVTLENLGWADFVVPVQRNHADHLIEDFPEAAPKIRFLAADVPDPYCGPVAEYREKRDILNNLLSRFVESL